jgi:uncharacterized damage-inducible protein DinB
LPLNPLALNIYFKSVFEELEHQRFEIVDLIKTVSPEKFNSQPISGKWTLAEILTHIITAEQLSLGYMKKKMPAIKELANSGLGESFRLLVLIISQRIPALKFKAPNVVLQNTPPPFTVQETLEKWEQHREELKRFLEAFDDAYVRKVLYKHPIAGRFNTRQALVFFREHIIHHLPQINRLLKQA